MTGTTSVDEAAGDRTLLLSVQARSDDALLDAGAEIESAPPLPSLPKTKAEKIAAIVADYADMKARKRGEWYLLEPGDPFYEDYEPFDTVQDAGPASTSFVQYFTPKGDRIHPAPAWSVVKPRRLTGARLNHFRSTPNELLIGRDGTLIVSAGRWGRREKVGGGQEYVPISDFWEWREAQLLAEPRTAEHRPVWAEEVDTIAALGCVEYSCSRGRFTYTQRLGADGKVWPAHGFQGVSFDNAADLRDVARDALALADALDNPPRVIHRLPEVDERIRTLEP